jgi:hypothetical protein
VVLVVFVPEGKDRPGGHTPHARGCPRGRGSRDALRRLVWIGLAIALAGCGETTIDGGELEGEIKEDAEAQGLVLDEVDCPSPEAEDGKRFECTVTVKGEERKLEVVQRNDDGNVGYDLAPLLESSAGNDAGGDEASVSFVIEAVNRDATALCDYATDQYRAELAAERSCAKAAIAEYDDPLKDYEVSVDGDAATVAGGARTVTLERQADGSWLIVDVAG